MYLEHRLVIRVGATVRGRRRQDPRQPVGTRTRTPLLDHRPDPGEQSIPRRHRAAVRRAGNPNRHGRREPRQEQAVVPRHRLGLQARPEPHDVAADRVDGEPAERGHSLESGAIGLALEPRPIASCMSGR